MSDEILTVVGRDGRIKSRMLFCRWIKSTISACLLSYQRNNTVALGKYFKWYLAVLPANHSWRWRDVTWDDWQVQFSAQHGVTILLRHCLELSQHCSNIIALKIVVSYCFGYINFKTRDLVRPFFFCSLADQNSNLTGHTSLARRSLKKVKDLSQLTPQ